MPIYEYCCEGCGHIFEEWQSGYEEKQFPCPICGGDSKRIVSHTSFVLKGSGWYATDYANTHTSPSSGSSGKESSEKTTGKAASPTPAPAAKSSESKPASSTTP